MYGSINQSATVPTPPGENSAAGIQEILDGLSIGLGLLNKELQVLHANTSLQQLLHTETGAAPSSSLFKILGSRAEQQAVMLAELQHCGRWQGVVPFRNQALRVEIKREASCGTDKGTVAFSLAVIDYTEDSKRLKELSAAKTQAEMTDKAKSRFLSHMSHELRTPLNAILGFTQLMQVTDSLSAIQQDNLKEIESAGTYLLSLINEILDLSRIEAGKIRLNEEKVAVELVMHDCVSLAKPLANKKNITMSYELTTHRPLLNDHVRLKQVLLNLLSNAVKYNNDGGSVHIRCFDADADHIQIEVRDTGPGIVHDMQAGIFTPFERLGADEKRIEGTGIGLMITRRLVQLMGGQIGIVSEPGRGSVFWVRLPAPGSLLTQSHGMRQLVSVGMDANYNAMLKRLVGMRQNLNLLVQPTLHEAIPQLLQYKPACVLLSATAAYELSLDHRNLKSLKNPGLVVVETNKTSGNTQVERSLQVDRSLFGTVLAEHHDLPALLDIMDRLFTGQ